MAKNIVSSFSIDLSGVVKNSITAVRDIRSTERVRKEAEFQRAIANGISYDAQLAFRQKQLDAEKVSPLNDQDYIATLEKSIADTKKLNRFNNYRTKYAATLGNLSSGKINEEQYLTTLKDQLSGVDDSELRLEIQGDIATAESKVKTYKDTILANQVKVAKYDGTESVLKDIILRVTNARAEASISGNQDEVTAHDETLAALNSQLTTTRIQNSLTDFQVKSSTRGTSPQEKLDYVNSEIQKADPNAPVKIGDRTYTSAQQFWTLERDNFLAGKSDVLGNFFDEFKSYTKDAIDNNVAKFGYPIQSVLDETLNNFNALRAKPEMAPFLSRLDTAQTGIMSAAVDAFTKKVADSAETSLQFNFADDQLKAAGVRYGIDTSVQRSALFQRVRGLEQSKLIPAGSAATLAAKLNVEIPEIKTEPVAPAALAAATTAAPVYKKPTLELPPKPMGSGEGGAYQEGDYVPGKGILTPDGTYRPSGSGDGGAYQEGDVVPGKGVLLPDGSYRPTATPTATPIPVTPTTPATYTGASIVDYLKSQNQDSSYTSRAKLAAEKGITGYIGSAKQNTDLLNLLRG